jgi:hypothetical protein
MQTIRFLRKSYNEYNEEHTPINDVAIWLFYELIQNDFICKPAREFLKNNIMLKGCYGNCCIVEIQEERAILSYYLYTLPGENNRKFELNRTHLLELINKWEDLSDHDAKQIIVRRDGERFQIDGVFE